MTAELVRLPTQVDNMIEFAIQHRDTLVKFTQKAMKEGVDYGVIPGTKEQTLLKPGAEKLCTLFRFVPEPEIIDRVEDWTGAEHGGEPFFYYLIRMALYRDGVLVGKADGSINSWEKKYRYRKAERVCPSCGAAAIIKGKAEYGGGWICFKKKEGCGEKFADGDQRIESQEVGQVANPDVFDLPNSLLKMAAKRALIAAVLICANASEFFTQDLEEMRSAEPPAQYVNTETGEVTTQEAEAAKPLSQRLSERLAAVGAEKSDLKILIRRICGYADNAPTSTKSLEWALSQPLLNWKATMEILIEERNESKVAEAAQPEPSEEMERLTSDDEFAEPDGKIRDAVGNILLGPPEEATTV